MLFRSLKLTEAERRAGVVTHSSGNHGQATACAAASVGARATVFMPADAPRIKMESQRIGLELRTVPAKESYTLTKMPLLLGREVAALWMYYLRPPAS